MSFISYAQNFEDVMLWRALKHVDNGFYIDVGANDPTADSVTRAFYERGWHGINIEPLPSHHADLLRDRPRDINLRCAAGASNGEIEIWECDVRGWATASADVVARHEADGHLGTFHKVPVATLADICTQHVRGEIHFLKIDVEGFEKSVIDGAEFSRFRPWILVIEATRPNSREELHDEWEGDLVLAGYLFGYSDGLNRFYVAKERAALLDALRYPPNVFDEFIRSEQLAAELNARQAEAATRQAEAATRQAEAATRQAQLVARLAEAASAARLAELQAVYASTSWRATRPLRAVKKMVDGDFSLFSRLTAKLASRVDRASRPAINNILGYVLRQPGFRALANRALRAFPWLRRRLYRAAVNIGAVRGHESGVNQLSFNLAHLDVAFEAQPMTPRARQIYAALIVAVDKKKHGNS